MLMERGRVNAASRSLFISEICFETFKIRFVKETVNMGSNKRTIDVIQVIPDIVCRIPNGTLKSIV